MTDDTKRSGSSEDSPSTNPETKGRGPGASPDANAAAPSDPLDMTIDSETPLADDELDAFANELVAENETLKSQIEDLTARLLRAHAENQNLHRRLEREREETAKYAITKFARDVVSVADNFDRAMSSIPADAAEESPVIKGLLEGFTMTEREFLNVLERHKVRRLTPKGDIFDPHLHQAMMEQQDPSVPSGTVLQVFQAGYVIEDRVLRPAMVVVAKGGPKAAKTKQGETAPVANPDQGSEPAQSEYEHVAKQPGSDASSAKSEQASGSAANENTAGEDAPTAGESPKG